MLENLSIMLLSVTLKTTALCLKLSLRSSILLDWSWLCLMSFSISSDKKYLHKSEKTTFYCINYNFTGNKQQIMVKSTQNVLFQWNCQSLGYSLISLLAPWKWKCPTTVMKIYIFFFIIIILFSLYAEKKNAHYAGIMLDAPTIALCPKLCQHNVSNPT